MMFRAVALALTVAAVSANIQVHYASWNSNYASNANMKLAAAGVTSAGKDVIFLCEQEHNAKANLLGGANKWAKNFLATGVKGFQPYDAALSGETGGSAMFGAGGMFKTTSTQLSVVVKTGVTVAKEASFASGNRNGKGWVGGRYKITKGGKDLLVGVGCTHMPTDTASSDYKEYIKAFNKAMADNSNANVDLWLYGGDINNRVDTTPPTPKTKTKPVNPPKVKELTDLVNAPANIITALTGGSDQQFPLQKKGDRPIRTYHDTTYDNLVGSGSDKLDMDPGTVNKFTYKYGKGGTVEFKGVWEGPALVKHVGFQTGGLDRILFKLGANTAWSVEGAQKPPSNVRGAYNSDHKLVERSFNMKPGTGRFMALPAGVLAPQRALRG